MTWGAIRVEDAKILQATHDQAKNSTRDMENIFMTAGYIMPVSFPAEKEKQAQIIKSVSGAHLWSEAKLAGMEGIKYHNRAIGLSP